MSYTLETIKSHLKKRTSILTKWVFVVLGTSVKRLLMSNTTKVRNMFNNLLVYDKWLKDCDRHIKDIAVKTFYCDSSQQAIDEVMKWNIKAYRMRTFINSVKAALSKMDDHEADILRYWTEHTIEECRDKFNISSTRTAFRVINDLATKFLRRYTNVVNEL